MERKLKILFVEDILLDAELIWREIEKNNIYFERLLVDNGSDFLEGLRSFNPDIIISDFSLPQFDGLKALLIRNENAPFIPFILVTGSINEEVAVECMKAGADDYILKGNLSRLGPAIKNAIIKIRLAEEKKTADENLKKSEMRLLKAQSIAHVGNWELDLSTKTIWFSNEGLNIFGFENNTNEIKLSQVQECVLKEFSPLMDELIDKLLKYNEPIEAEFKIKHFTENDLRSVYLKAELIVEPDSEQVKVLGVIQDITNRKKAEEDLKNSQQIFQTLSLLVPVGIFRTNPDGYTTYLNPKYCELADLTNEKALGFGWLNSVHPEDREKLSKNWLENVRNGQGSGAEYRFIRKNGSIIWVTGNVVPEYNEGIITGYIGTIIDITDQKNFEERIIQERSLLRTLIDNIPDTIYIKDLDCRKILANKSDIEIMGVVSEEEILGKTDIELFPGKTGERGYYDDLDVIHSGKAVIEREEDFIDSKGERRWLLTTKVPVVDKNGKISGLVGIGHDITVRKRVEEELNQSSLFNESLLKTIPFGMDIVDETGTVLFQSDNFKILFGPDALGKKCWELYRDDKIQCSDCPLIKGICIGETEAYESHGVLGNRIFEINHTGMLYQGRKAMLEIFQDITERKNHEQDLLIAKEKAEESDRLKTAFLHNISHEIRTPLNAIVGFSTLLGENDIDTLIRQSYVEIIMQSSDHLLSIISDIVEISNIEAGIVKKVKSAVNLNSLVKSLFDQFIKNANQKNLALSFNNGLEEKDASILTDKTKLVQILSNLLSNALKFTDTGEIKLEYRVNLKFIEFSVTDTGIGIPPDYHNKIFDRFYQVKDSKSRLYEGTGLGLAISKAYVEILGGKIWLSSNPGQGSSFYFTIPYEKQVLVSKTPPLIESTNKVVFSERKRILVAEDVESNFELIRYFLSGANVEIIRASNGKEAVDKCLSDISIDLVMMDIKMPVMDGYTATKLIREKNSKIPIIAQTAFADDLNKAVESGCSGFISKPFTKKSLLKTLAEHI